MIGVARVAVTRLGETLSGVQVSPRLWEVATRGELQERWEIFPPPPVSLDLLEAHERLGQLAVSRLLTDSVEEHLGLPVTRGRKHL